MTDTEFAARLRHCHADVFGLDKPDWINAPDHEQVRWLMVAERYRVTLARSLFRDTASGMLLYLAWDIDGYCVPWPQLRIDKRNGWISAAREAATWGQDKAA